MITIICSTNRPQSRSSIVAKRIQQILEEKNIKANYLDLKDFDSKLIHEDMFNSDQMHEDIKNIQDNIIIPSNKLIMVLPEYNGGIPGIFKLFIDALSIRKYKDNFQGKKSILVGVASGRSGNLRGLEYLTGCLNYLGMHVFPKKFCLSLINKHINENGDLDEEINSILTEIADASKIY